MHFVIFINFVMKKKWIDISYSHTDRHKAMLHVGIDILLSDMSCRSYHFKVDDRSLYTLLIFVLHDKLTVNTVMILS